jgi:hypothetical protein
MQKRMVMWGALWLETRRTRRGLCRTPFPLQSTASGPSSRGARFSLSLSLFHKSFTVTMIMCLRFFFEQFGKASNFFFLFTACISTLGAVAVIPPPLAVSPLLIVLSITAIKEIIEDIRRVSYVPFPFSFSFSCSPLFLSFLSFPFFLFFLLKAPSWHSSKREAHPGPPKWWINGDMLERCNCGRHSENWGRRATLRGCYFGGSYHQRKCRGISSLSTFPSFLVGVK